MVEALLTVMRNGVLFWCTRYYHGMGYTGYAGYTLETPGDT